MSAIAALHALRLYRDRYFAWRADLAWFKKLVLAFGMACATGLAAQVRVPLPFTPVPVTGQVFAVLLGGVLLGSCYGGLSQAFYVGLGAAGLPWFAGFSAGLPMVTGGYIVGFVPAAALVGMLSDRSPRFRTLTGQMCLMMGAVCIIYLFGAVQFAFVMRTGLIATLGGAVVPFIPVDIAKAAVAAALGSAILPGERRSPRGDEHSAPDDSRNAE